MRPKKMKEIGEYDPFFDFFMFQSKRWVGVKKNVTIPKLVAIFKREIFLNIGRNRKTLASKSAEKKGRWLTHFRFFFASLCKTKLLNPRYAWEKFIIEKYPSAICCFPFE
jgi:hypothetical protein